MNRRFLNLFWRTFYRPAWSIWSNYATSDTATRRFPYSTRSEAGYICFSLYVNNHGSSHLGDLS